MFNKGRFAHIQGGWTPLMEASSEGHVDIVRTLIDAKAQINAQRKVHCILIIPYTYGNTK